jgi:hypothetical protein
MGVLGGAGCAAPQGVLCGVADGREGTGAAAASGGGRALRVLDGERCGGGGGAGVSICGWALGAGGSICGLRSGGAGGCAPGSGGLGAETGANDNLVCTSGGWDARSRRRGGCGCGCGGGFGALRSLGGLRPAGEAGSDAGWGVSELLAGRRRMIFLRGGEGGGVGDGGSLKLESVSGSGSGVGVRARLRGDVSGLTLCRRLGPRRFGSSFLRPGGGDTELDSGGSRKRGFFVSAVLGSSSS